MGRPSLVVAQSGGPTAAINASLAGVFAEAERSERIGRILGLRFGIDGLLGGTTVDLRSQDPSVWPRLRRTPSAALGSSRHKLGAAEVDQALEALIALDARFLIYIGGNDSADTALALHAAALARGHELRVVAVPKTIDNDLPETDHCPGFGSAARFLAQVTQDVGLDTWAMRRTDPIKLIEVMGRDAGWLAASTVLGRLHAADPPHLVCVPERPLDPGTFLSAVAESYSRHGYVVAVVAETVRDASGQAVGRADQIRERDAFGHPTLAGAAQALSRLLGEALGLKARFDKPGTIQRMCMALASPVDLEEAFAAGATAVRYALQGHSGCMVSLQRLPGPEYRCETVPVPLERIANRHRVLPPALLGEEPFGIAPEFAAYAGPLIGPPIEAYPRLV